MAKVVMKEKRIDVKIKKKYQKIMSNTNKLIGKKYIKMLWIIFFELKNWRIKARN